jgi:hypothetical protein
MRGDHRCIARRQCGTRQQPTEGRVRAARAAVMTHRAGRHGSGGAKGGCGHSGSNDNAEGKWDGSGGTMGGMGRGGNDAEHGWR